jgi:hypothetical protein
MYSPAEIDGASPSTVTRSRCPRALTRRTQNPLSVLWKVTRSTKPASASRSLEELDPAVSIRARHKLKGHMQAITLSCNLGREPTRPAPAPQRSPRFERGVPPSQLHRSPPCPTRRARPQSLQAGRAVAGTLQSKRPCLGLDARFRHQQRGLPPRNVAEAEAVGGDAARPKA